MFRESDREKPNPWNPQKTHRMAAVPAGAVHGALVLCSRADIRHDCESGPRGEAGRVLRLAHRSVMYRWRHEGSHGPSTAGLIKPNECRDYLTQLNTNKSHEQKTQTTFLTCRQTKFPKLTCKRWVVVQSKSARILQI